MSVVTLPRFALCPLSPLDEQLALPVCDLASGLYEPMVRLSTWIPAFKHTATELSYFTCADVPESTVRRLTQPAGAAYVQVQQLSVAGAMVNGQELSYISRLAAADGFTRAAVVATHM